jgi:hypothetical protein
MTSDSFKELSEDGVEKLKGLAKELHVREPRLAYWMWRSWLLQKDFDGADETDESSNLRTTNEFYDLPDEIVEQREACLARLSELFENLSSVVDGLPLAAQKAHYAVDGLQGSPRGVVATSIHLLEAELAKLRKFQRLLSAAYGFGSNHHPNLRFDKMTRATIQAFVAAKNGGLTKESADAFSTEDKSRQHARNNASKAAYAFETKRLPLMDKMLAKYEAEESVPTWFYARHHP